MLDCRLYHNTAEGNHNGPTLSFPLYSTTVLLLVAQTDNPRYYTEFIHLLRQFRQSSPPRVLQMVMDSCATVVESVTFDGFRSIWLLTLASGPNVLAQRPFLTAVRQEPRARAVKLVAYLGFSAWAAISRLFSVARSEWNDRYHPHVHAALLSGRSKPIGEVSSRLTRGSSEPVSTMTAAAPPAPSSNNHITVHDVFTLADLVSATTPSTTRPIGEDNRDGANDNHSNNGGHERPYRDPSHQSASRHGEGTRLAVVVAQGLAAGSGRR